LNQHRLWQDLEMQGRVGELQKFYDKMQVCGKRELWGHVERECELVDVFMVKTQHEYIASTDEC
jgi:hypothetical protein